MKVTLHEVVEDLKAYLEYLKEVGVEALPVKAMEPLTGKSKEALSSLDEIREEMGDCRRCKLHSTRKNLVFGEGNDRAVLMFIGEGPGYDEDTQGRPFVGKAGQLLTRIIQSINLQREEVYIANIVKCRPPQNRNPEPDEILACRPFLMKQIESIRPRIICALGSVATRALLQTEEKITSLRGKPFDFNGIRLIPTYHPAFLLRNPERKREVWEDMKCIAAWLRDMDYPFSGKG